VTSSFHTLIPLIGNENVPETYLNFFLLLDSVYKVLGTLNNSSDRIGDAISIDEFKGNVGTKKYQTIVVDTIKHEVLDILYSEIVHVCLNTLSLLISPNAWM